MSVSRPVPCFILTLLFAATTALADSPFVATAEKASTHILSDPSARYTVNMGGTADMDNTATRHHETWSIAFQNNISLTLENTGDLPVVNPRVITNGKRRWHSVESMIAEFTEGAQSAQEKIYQIWEGLRQNRHHDYPLFGGDYHDPVRFLNVYGGGFCDDSSASGAALYSTAGFNAAKGGQDPFQRGLHGHVMCEVWHDGDYQFMDIDQDTFFLDRENRKPVSGDALVRDHDLARRELAFGPLFQGWDAAIPNAALFGVDDIKTTYWSTGHTMGYALRPGERITFHWNKPQKTPWELQAHVHRFFSNSELVYTLPAEMERLETTDVTMEGFSADGSALAIDKDGATITIPVSTAYTICGATLQAEVSRNFPPSAAFIVELSLDGKTFSEIYRRMALPRWTMNVPLDTALTIAGGPPKRQYWIRIRCDKAVGASLLNVAIKTDLYAYPIALPRLSVGQNTVDYSDETDGPHEITVTHCWRESGNVTPPMPPAAPTSPAPDVNVSKTFVPFSWPATEGCDAYWLRVSRDPDFRYPYRPNYDVVLPTNSYEVPFRGMFSPGETYYWRVRPRLANGLWGKWSDTWQFTWAGPTVPHGVRLNQEGQRITLHWRANPSGTAPHRYRIYASNERGFSIGTKETRALDPGPEPVSFESDQEHLVVGGPDAEAAIGNHAYYRVVAIDADGVESCPSDYVELPRPWVHTVPVAMVKAGDMYNYAPKTIASLGDWQHRYDSPGDAFWEKESYRFTLAEGPDWLTVDEDTGRTHGKPPADARGDFPVALQVDTLFRDEIPEDGISAQAFLKPKEAMKGTGVQRFIITVIE